MLEENKNYTMKKFHDEQCKITYTNKMCSSAAFQAFSIIIEWHIHWIFFLFPGKSVFNTKFY